MRVRVATSLRFTTPMEYTYAICYNILVLDQHRLGTGLGLGEQLRLLGFILHTYASHRVAALALKPSTYLSVLVILKKDILGLMSLPPPPKFPRRSDTFRRKY